MPVASVPSIKELHSPKTVPARPTRRFDAHRGDVRSGGTILRRLMMQAVERRAMAASLLTLAIAAVTVQVVRAAPTPTGSVKYGIVFDAGSSGTRIHVYSWRVGGGGPKDAFDLIGDDLLKKKPGLSAYKEKTAEAGSSLTELLNHARAKIPAALHAETPIFLMATAGLRMVGEKAKDEILASVCAELSSSGFLFRCGRRLALTLTLTLTPNLDPTPHSQGRAPAGTWPEPARGARPLTCHPEPHQVRVGDATERDRRGPVRLGD